MADTALSLRKSKSAPSTLARLLQTCAGLVKPGQRVGVAVSGGADSVALLRLLLELQKDLGVVVSVVHLNHKLRGKASDGDEKFVAALAAKDGLDFHLERVDIGAKAKREKANLEDAARRARYQFFSRLVEEKKVDCVAVAHTADDQAETVLAHILRGTGLAGLGGIHPETETVIRPLLRVRRPELRAYLRSKKQKWREDATNQDASRLRARIRKKLLPLLERQFQREIVPHLVTLAELAREDERFLDWIAAEHCDALAEKTGDAARIAIAELLSPLKKKDLNTESIEKGTKNTKMRTEKGSLALINRMLRRLIDETKGEVAAGSAQITAQHIGGVLELARQGENGKELQLPGGVNVRRENDALVFLRRAAPKLRVRSSGVSRAKSKRLAAASSSSNSDEDSAQEFAYEHQIDFQKGTATIAVPQVSCVFRLRVIDWPANRGETSGSGTILDGDRLRPPLVLRNWRPGDRLHPAGHQKAHKLKRLLNEKRISRWERRGWPVLTSAGTLVWARGFPVAAGYGASAETRKGISIAEEKS